MRILRIYTKLPPLKGGMEKHIYYLTRLQLENNHFVKVFYNVGNKISFNDEKISSFRLYKIKPQFIGVILFYILVIFKLLFKREKFDVVHIHGDWSSLLFVNFLRKLTNSKIVVFSIHDQITKRFTHQKWLPRLLKNIDLIFSTGYESAYDIEKLIGTKIIVQPSGINQIFFEEFEKEFDKDNFTVVTVANLLPKKNINLVLEIAKELPCINFIIVGDGIEKESLKTLIKRNKLLNVELVGFKSSEEIKRIYQASDCYLLTSFAEGTPTSALEAMACGLPIVSSNAGGVENIIKNNVNGFVIRDFDKKRYINKLLLIKKDKNLRKKIFLENKKLSRNYKWDKVSKNITENMEKVLNEKD